LSLTWALAVVNCQSTPFCDRLRRTCHAASSEFIVSKSGMRLRPRRKASSGRTPRKKTRANACSGVHHLGIPALVRLLVYAYHGPVFVVRTHIDAQNSSVTTTNAPFCSGGMHHCVLRWGLWCLPRRVNTISARAAASALNSFVYSCRGAVCFPMLSLSFLFYLSLFFLSIYSGKAPKAF